MALRDHPNTSAAERAAAVAGIARIKAAHPASAKPASAKPSSAKPGTSSNFRDFAHTSLVFRTYLRGKIPNEKLKSTAAALAKKHPEVDMITPENVVFGHIKKHLG